MVSPTPSTAYLLQTPPPPDGPTIATMLGVAAAAGRGVRIVAAHGRVVFVDLSSEPEEIALRIASAMRGLDLDRETVAELLGLLVVVAAETRGSAPPWEDRAWRERVLEGARRANGTDARVALWLLGPAPAPSRAVLDWACDLSRFGGRVLIWGHRLSETPEDGEPPPRAVDAVISPVGPGGDCFWTTATSATHLRLEGDQERIALSIVWDQHDPSPPAPPPPTPPTPTPAELAPPRPPQTPPAEPGPLEIEEDEAPRAGRAAEPLPELAGAVLAILRRGEQPLTRNAIAKALKAERGRGTSHVRLATALETLEAHGFAEQETVDRYGQTMPVWTPALSAEEESHAQV